MRGWRCRKRVSLLLETAMRMTFSIVVIILAGIMLVGFPKFGRAYTVVVFYIFATFGTILVQTLPLKNKIGLLFSYWVNSGHIFSFFQTTSS